MPSPSWCSLFRAASAAALAAVLLAGPATALPQGPAEAPRVVTLREAIDLALVHSPAAIAATRQRAEEMTRRVTEKEAARQEAR